jgi:ribonuclease J
MTASGLRVVPLGGLGEVGMNCLALVEGSRAIVIDCGVTFAEADFGVDAIHPDFGFLDEVSLAGIVITHGHEDHIGALPYILRRHDVPVYGPKYALALVREKLREHEILSHARLVEVGTRSPYELGPFGIEHMRVTHSIADATAVAIRTSQGTVIHTGDFKFDETPPDGEAFDEARFRELGDAGVALLMSDSTNVESDGEAGSEESVRTALRQVLLDTEGAVVVGLFASNVHRLRVLGELARETSRRIVLAGRSVHTHVRVAHDTGYLDWPNGTAFPIERSRELPRRSILAIATGTQAEENAALAKLSRGEHPHLSLMKGDAVVFSSRVIPGHDPEVYALMSDLTRLGVTLHTKSTNRGLHVSGHAYRGEQRRMLELVRPKSFIPLHGTRVHLERHAALAREVGIPDTCVLENGNTAWLGDSGLSRGEDVHRGRVRVFAKHPIAESTMAARRALAECGVLVCTLRVDARGQLASPPLLDEKGVTNDRERARLFADVTDEVTRTLAELGPPLTEERLAEAARLAIRRAVSRRIGRRPVPIVQVVKT